MSNKLFMEQQYLSYLPPEMQQLRWQFHPLDGKLLLFERDNGLNVLLEGEETQALHRLAPRTLLIAVTNVCNLSCAFCYRDLHYSNDWDYASLLEFCQQAHEWGVLEVAFGGGEPMLFPQWEQFIYELYDTTQLAINFTTNGMLLTSEFLDNITGKYGQIRVSLYNTNHPEKTIQLLVKHHARFGVNWLITPQEFPTIKQHFMELYSIGVRDFLLIGYKGNAFPNMHFQADDYLTFSQFLNETYEQYPDVTLKLDVCWGKSLNDVPRLFIDDDCHAGDGFLSITSNKAIKPCSFHQWTIPFKNLEDVKTYWQHNRQKKAPANIGGCARLPNRGINQQGGTDATIHVATI